MTASALGDRCRLEAHDLFIQELLQLLSADVVLVHYREVRDN